MRQTLHMSTETLLQCTRLQCKMESTIVIRENT